MKYLNTIILFFLTLTVSAQQGLLLAGSPAGSPLNGILDGFTGTEVAYATSLLFSSYKGPCLRVRRSSDNAEQDIGFSGKDLDEASLISFCSGTNCFVKIWYDQDGTPNDAIQTNASNQPKIYDNSIGLIKLNGITALNFNNSPFFTISAISVTSAWSSFYVEKKNTTGSNSMWIGTSVSGVPYTVVHFSNGTYYSGTYSPNKVYTGPNSVTNDHAIFSSITDQATFLATYKNGSSVGSFSGSSTGAATNGQFNYIARRGTNYSDTKLQLIVLYLSDKSTSRTGIESAINSYYAIY